MILLAADGLENKKIAVRLGQDPGKVGRWRQRYVQMGLAGILKDKTRPGRIAPIAASMRSRIVKLTLTAKPAGATHWSRKSLAREVGVSPSTCGAHLGGQWFEAASDQDLQAFQGQAIRREA